MILICQVKGVKKCNKKAIDKDVSDTLAELDYLVVRDDPLSQEENNLVK